jgi:transcriptional regulator with XRE-family HTH domain
MGSYTAITDWDVGSNIREARMQQGITQAELATAVGVHRRRR